MAPFVAGDSGSIRDLEHILWHVRLSVLLQLYHWKLRSQGIWTVEPGDAPEATVDRLINHAQYVHQGFQA